MPNRSFGYLVNVHFLLVVFIFVSCKNEKVNTGIAEVQIKNPIKHNKEVVKDSTNLKLDSLPDYLKYSFLKGQSNDFNLNDAIPAPPGFNRIDVAKNSFAEWLRYHPVKKSAKEVLLYNGALKGNQTAHHAILDIDVGKRDLQQCADAVMRLRAEYFYSQNAFEKIHFNFTSGDKVSFSDWAQGRKPVITGNKVQFTSKGNSTNTSYSNFKSYLNIIFSYAGTASLSKELIKVEKSDLQIGDVFIQGGFPGHAILVMDIVQNQQDEKLFLLAQSYMPAQDMHILKNFNDPHLSPWYSMDFENELSTPEWTFYKSDLKRFQ